MVAVFLFIKEPLYASFIFSGNFRLEPLRRRGQICACISEGVFMGDVLSLVVGLAIFALLIVYVPACEKV